MSRWFANQLVSNEHFMKISDEKYRDIAFDNTVSPLNDRGISFVDNIIRTMLKDKSAHINALVTFNRRDFEDICYEKGIEILDEKFSPSF